jgi:hypothetical protein
LQLQTEKVFGRVRIHVCALWWKEVGTKWTSVTIYRVMVRKI